MASRPQLKPHLVIANESMAADIISEVTIISNLSMVSYDISWSGTSPVGAMSVQVSNTYSENADGSVRDAGSWTTIDLSSPCPVTGNTGNGMIDGSATGTYAIRLVYTRASGTGLMNATVVEKVA